MKTVVMLLLIPAVIGCARSAQAEWAINKDHIVTQWAADVKPDLPLPEYPRPDMERAEWLNLNGIWDYAIVPQPETKCGRFPGQILVPYPIESALSGVAGRVEANQRLWYRRTVELPVAWSGKRVLLHFGAVDWECSVRVNGKELGTHRGGYDAFSFDITDVLKPSGLQEIVLVVWDPTDAGYQPRGKQVLTPEGIWYTAVTGIWQTVWIEPVPETAIQRLKLTPDIDAGALSLTVQGSNVSSKDTIEAQALDGTTVAGNVTGPLGQPLALQIEKAKLWSPDSPFLYGLKVVLKRDGQVVDEVKSYFGMRKISVAKDAKGVLRLCLNNAPLFQFGPLDQGWWPDGLYTAPTDAALRHDVEMTRAMGFNMARKHVKVEPARWYYHCDQLWLLVWQDMPSGDRYIGYIDDDIVRAPESKTEYYQEFQAIIEGLYNHPSIVMWVPFNEGWGQFDTAEVAKWVKEKDPSRLANPTSGWVDRNVGDVHDMHNYPGPGMFPVGNDRASVLGEFGGLGWPIEGHCWLDKKNWGYRSFTDQAALRESYAGLVARLRPLIGSGLSAAVYTQTTDVEIEVNGLMTYDRELVKMDAEWLAKTNSTVYLPPPVCRVIVPSSEKEPQVWKYTFEKPSDGWEKESFAGTGWKEGPGPLGSKTARNATPRTPWESPDIWLRRTFTLEKAPAGDVLLVLHHDDDAEVYLNGVLAAKEAEHTAGYGYVPLSKEAAATLRAGKNVIAIHCRNEGKNHCIDAGLEELE